MLDELVGVLYMPRERRAALSRSEVVRRLIRDAHGNVARKR